MTPPLAGTPQAGTPPLPGQVQPLRAGTPPGQVPPWAGTPPRQVHPPWAGTPPPGQVPPGQVHPALPRQVPPLPQFNCRITFFTCFL